MNSMSRSTEICNFINHCNSSKLEKKVLNCHSNEEYLCEFKNHGYEIASLELSDSDMESVEKIGQDNKINIELKKGSMTYIPFDDEEFSFVSLYDEFFHLRKDDVEYSLEEISRVLKPGGLCLINFLSIKDYRFGNGVRIGYEEYIDTIDGKEVIYSYFHEGEAENYLNEFKIVSKHKHIKESAEGKLAYTSFILKKI